jgi:hypothetical protein
MKPALNPTDCFEQQLFYARAINEKLITGEDGGFKAVTIGRATDINLVYLLGQQCICGLFRPADPG